MTKNRKISSLEFDYLANMKPYVAPNDENGKKSLKYVLIDAVERAFGDMWFNLNEKTRQAVDYICFLSVEHGFFYASPEHIATRSSIGKSTIYKALKMMRESNVLVKVNRSSRKQNGLGCPVHFFTEHPYFQHYNTYLDLKWKPEEKANEKAENAEIPCGSKDEDSEKFSTLLLSSPYQEQKIDIQPNVGTESYIHNLDISDKKKTPIIKYVPKEINSLYARTFGFRLRMVWVKITQAFNSIKQSILNRHDLITHGANIIKRLFIVWKDHMRKNSDMTVDEMCAFAYKSARETFFNVLGELHMENMPKEERSIAKSHSKRTVANKTHQKPKEPMSDWMIKLQEEKEQIKQQLMEAKADIPRLEDLYLAINPNSPIDQVKDAVIQSLKEKYALLDRHAISEIEQVYGKLTGRPEEYSVYSKRHFDELLAKLRESKPKPPRPDLIPDELPF